ncbi:unnamed protein product [Rhizoctonia solani]|uniref:Uncharacterized protein n=1 Tax=Rhizoctonia solani TaxID=456999 RepID=A0A8H3HX19_9AGAM|nr:unnamed protein product [Rhizoctonia solani]
MTTTEATWQTSFSDERRQSVASFYPSPTSNPMSEKDGYESRRGSGISVVADTGRDQAQRERVKEKEAQVEDEDAGQTAPLIPQVLSASDTRNFSSLPLPSPADIPGLIPSAMPPPGERFDPHSHSFAEF